MSDGIEIAVQIRAPGPDPHKDVPVYYTSEYEIEESSLELYSERLVRDVMEMATQDVIADYVEDTKNE